MNTLNKISRRKSSVIKVGNVPVGGDSPISVQSMTNTNTEDVKSTVKQVKELEEVGADIVRISTPSEESVVAFGQIKNWLMCLWLQIFTLIIK